MKTLKDNPNKYIIWWLLIGCYLVFLMVIIGGITRLTHSGLSIVEWKVITGTFPPTSELEWVEEFAKYQQTPEFKKINAHFTLGNYKSIYWWEYIHRLLGRIIGFVFVIPLIWFVFKKKIKGTLIYKTTIIFLLGAFQGFLGWYMVYSGLIDKPAVSHYRLAAHLLTAFACCGYIFWVALGLIYKDVWVKRDFPRLRKLSIILLVVTVLQIFYGALVAGLRAGLIYNMFPHMGSGMLPDEFWHLTPGWLNLFENPVTVQFIHRWLGFVVLGIGSYIFYLSKKEKMLYGQRFAVNAVFFMLCDQVLLGIITLLAKVPVWLGVLHQAVACIVLILIIFMIYRLRGNIGNQSQEFS